MERILLRALKNHFKKIRNLYMKKITYFKGDKEYIRREKDERRRFLW